MERKLGSWALRLTIALAALATLLAAGVVAFLVLVPALGDWSYLDVHGDRPDTADGSLVILRDADPGAVAAGDRVALAHGPAGTIAVFGVFEVDEATDTAVLVGAEGDPLVVAPRAALDRRVGTSLDGLGGAYAFIDGGAGWGVITGVVLALWGAVLVLRLSRRSAPVLEEAVAAPAPAQEGRLAAVPRGLPAAAVSPPLSASAIAAPPAAVVSAASAASVSAASAAPMLRAVRRIAREAPLHGTASVSAASAAVLRAAATQRPSRRTVGSWATLAATMTAVAAATFLVAEEQHRFRHRAGRR